jgi:hypothetical protein
VIHLHDRIRTYTVIEFNQPYLLLTLIYMAGIYWLSSLSNLGIRGIDTSLLHVPLYAGLAFCLLKAMPEARPRQAFTWKLPGLIFVSAAAYAALDEWHQSFVPGRDASTGDFSLDLLGIGLMLILARF